MQPQQKDFVYVTLTAILEMHPNRRHILSTIGKLLDILCSVTTSESLLKGVLSLVKPSTKTLVTESILLDTSALKESYQQFLTIYEAQQTTFRLLDYYKDCIGSLESLLAEQISRISGQIELDKSLIKEEFQDVISDIVVESERAMLGRLATSDISRKDVWDKFGKEQSSLILENRWNRSQQKLNQIIEQRHKDINAITKELEVANSSVKSLMSRQHSLGLIPNSSPIYQFQNKIDNIADNITSTALTGAAIATMGMAAAAVIKAGATTAMFSTPPWSWCTWCDRRCSALSICHPP